MRYLPKSPAERQEMLAAIGVRSAEALFSSIPERYRLKQPLNLPGPLSEAEIISYFKERAAENSSGYSSFLGAGVYNHLRSVVTDVVIQRGEFLTSYTPYQAEITQGTLQAIFEFQTLMCQLTGQEVANASMYDGSTATTEAVLMAERLTDRRRVLVARSLHPEYRHVLQTYARNCGLQLEEQMAPLTARRCRVLCAIMLPRWWCNRRIFLARLNRRRSLQERHTVPGHCWWWPLPRAFHWVC